MTGLETARAVAPRTSHLVLLISERRDHLAGAAARRAPAALGVGGSRAHRPGRLGNQGPGCPPAAEHGQNEPRDAEHQASSSPSGHSEMPRSSPPCRASRARAGCSACRGCARRRSPRARSGVITRTSTWRPSTVKPTRPFCGSRRTEMSRSAMILILDTTPRTSRWGTVIDSTSTPSTRMRTRSSRPGRPV